MRSKRVLPGPLIRGSKTEKKRVYADPWSERGENMLREGSRIVWGVEKGRELTGSLRMGVRPKCISCFCRVQRRVEGRGDLAPIEREPAQGGSGVRFW